MKLRLTSDEMLDEWRKRKGIGPFRSDSAIRLTYGIDMDAVGRMEMRDWYLKMLHTAPPSMLVPTECRDMADMSGGDGTMEMDQRVVRVLSVKMTAWQKEAAVCDCTHEAMKRASNPFTTTPMTPMAMWDGRRLTVAPYEPGDCAESIIAITDDGPDIYNMDESALSTIKPTPI